MTLGRMQQGFLLSVLKNTGLGEKVYDLIKQQIYDHTFPTDGGVFEAQLAERLGVSRTPVREAICLLKSEGLLEQLPGGGLRALPITAQDLDDAFSVRTALEGVTVELAAERMAPEQHEHLADILDRTEAYLAQGRLGDVLAENEVFHKYLAACTGSRLVELMLERIYDHVKASRWQTIVTGEPNVLARVGVSHEEHCGVAAALRAGDGPRARRLMEDHLSNNAAYLKAHLPLDDRSTS